MDLCGQVAYNSLIKGCCAAVNSDETAMSEAFAVLDEMDRNGVSACLARLHVDRLPCCSSRNVELLLLDMQRTAMANRHGRRQCVRAL
eukprot:1508274-Rhodomonas_salina.6